jgi:hypothetical protein
MPRKPTVTKRATYRHGVEWIALNDNTGDDNPAALTASDGPGAAQAMRERIAGYISTLLLADLFGADPARVAHDIFRVRFENFLDAAVPEELGVPAEEAGGPNLDDMGIDDLKTFAERHVHGQMPHELFPHRNSAEAVKAVAELVAYARKILIAKKYRLDGHIRDAQHYEELAGIIYKRLPPWAKW